jgi:hypothetical protein
MHHHLFLFHLFFKFSGRPVTWLNCPVSKEVCTCDFQQTGNFNGVERKSCGADDSLLMQAKGIVKEISTGLIDGFDRVSLVSYNHLARVDHPIQEDKGFNRKAFEATLNSLSAAGFANMQEGFQYGISEIIKLKELPAYESAKKLMYYVGQGVTRNARIRFATSAVRKLPINKVKHQGVEFDREYLVTQTLGQYVGRDSRLIFGQNFPYKGPIFDLLYTDF